jgi:hypothetical protein
MDAQRGINNPYIADTLSCDECEVLYSIPRSIEDEKRYVSRKLESRDLQNVQVLNIDDEAIPLAKAKAESKDNKYYVKAIFTESKVGHRLIVYAGEKGKPEKTQIFVEPEIKRLAFDQKDINPSEVFIKLEATFEDGSTHSINRNEQ